MSIIRTVDIQCDWPGCHRLGCSDGIAVTAAEARRQLRRFGWAYKRAPAPARHGVDLCSQHAHLSRARPDEYAEAFWPARAAGGPEGTTP